MSESIQPLCGGILIGLSVTLMLLFSGRVTGISGIIGGLIKPLKTDYFWRLSFIFGLISGGYILNEFLPSAFVNTLSLSSFQVAIAGVLVGFGTLLGGGCTSGHGVCGVSRLSLRSLIATIIFISTGMISVIIMRKLGLIL